MTDPLIALLYRLNQNQNALGAAIEELAIWVEQRGSVDAANRAKQHLQVLVDNSDSIAEALADLVAKQSI